MRAESDPVEVSENFFGSQVSTFMMITIVQIRDTSDKNERENKLLKLQCQVKNT